MRQRSHLRTWMVTGIVAAMSWLTTSDQAGLPGGRVEAQAPQAQAPRAGQSATRLPDGRWLLAGGDGALATAALWDPRTQTTTPTTSPLQVPRARHSATLLADGTVVLVGGRDGTAPVEVAERFDASSGLFTVLPIVGSTPRASHTATLLTDGRLLIAGGSNGGAAPLATEIWDIEAGTATAIATAIGRAGQTATLLADGRVRLSGGASLDGTPNTDVLMIDPIAGSVQRLEAPAPEPAEPVVAGSIPAPGADEVPLDARLAVRFSTAVVIDSVTADTVTLTGPDGGVTTRVIAAEGGRLAFVWPAAPLTEATTYVLRVAGAIDARGTPVVPTAIAFTTVARRTEAPDQGDAEDWIPDEASRETGWRTHRPPSPWETLAPLMAPPGVTAISGRVLTLDGRPLPRVTLAMDGAGTTRSDGTGRFLLEAPALAGGRHVLDIDGKTASVPTRTYGFFEYGLTVTPGQTTVLPFTIWMPKLDTPHAVSIASPTTSETVVTTPSIPGLELHLPAGTVVRGEDGQVVTRLSITPVPVDRPPFPLATNVEVPVYFTIQPGGAYVRTLGTGPKGAQLVYPNYRQEYAGKRMQFFHYDPSVKDWYVYGLGTVTPDETHVVPDPTTRLYSFTGAMINGGDNPGGPGGPPGNCGDNGGDPVKLPTGLFVLEETDLALPDVIPIALTRTYRSQDLESRPFGYGMTHPYAMFLWSAQQYTEADLILPDGGRVHYVRVSAGTGWTDAIFAHQETATTAATPTAFYKSTLAWNSHGWDLRLIDGTVYVFGENAPLQAIRDRYGNTITITHASANGQSGNVTRVTSSNGRWLAFSYGANGRISQVTDNIGRTVTYTYDGNNNLASVTDPENHVTSYTYDSSHRLLTVKPPNLQGTQTNLVTNEYTTAADAPTPVGWVKKQTHADGGVYQFAYTVANGVSTQTDVTDPRGFVRRVTFNSWGYCLSDTRALGQAEVQASSSDRPTANNFITSQTNTHGDVTTTDYDALGRVTRVTRLPGTADEAITTYTYDPVWASEVATITDPLNHTTTFGYDTRGNRTSITDALNHTTTFTYNAAGHVTSVTDPLQHTTTYEYTGPDLTKITDPLGRVTQRFFDAGGRMLAQTDPAGQITRFTYDKVNHLTQLIDPLGGLTTFGYDTPGRLASVTDALTHATTYGYDAFNRLASRTDPLSKMETFTYDLDGNPSQQADRKGQVTTRSYDALNRLHQITYADNSTITYTYDSGNRLSTIEDSLSGTITRTYDNLDRLTSETTPQGSISYTFDKVDRRATMTVAGQLTVTYGYDNANRLTSITQGTSSVTFTYDNADRRSTLTYPNGIVATYGYDNANQLTSLTYTLGQTTLGDLTYTYDLAGRRTAVGGTWARTGLPAAVADTTHDAGNRLVSWGGQSFSYDANGNLASDGLTSQIWDVRDQLSAIAGSASAQFAYDALGRRRASSAGGAPTTTFLYDGFHFLQELIGSTPFVNLIAGLLPDEYFAVIDSTGSHVILSDGLRSTIATLDDSGSLESQYTYEPFGRSIASGLGAGVPATFTAREDDHTGYFFYRARYYAPQFGRFISEDPDGLADGPNLYSYVSNSPTNFIDPFGLCTVDPDILSCLEQVFKKSAADVRVESRAKPNSKWAATTRRNKITIFIPCDDFFNDHETVLEEYYHVLEQWNTGRLNKFKYVWQYLLHGYEKNKYEVEAKEFAKKHLEEFEKCLCRRR